MYRSFIYSIFLILISLNTNSTSFTLDTYNIEINSSFLGKEIMLFGQKNENRDIIIIFEGNKQEANLDTKVKKGLFWVNTSKSLSDIPSFFGIFTTPKKSLNEIFLIPKITEKHILISNFSEGLFQIRKALKAKGLYYEEQLEESEGNLFYKKFEIPDNISEGDIKIYFYEIFDGEILSSNEKNLSIEKKGLTSNLENLLTEQSFFYVFILIVFSIAFSLISNLIFRKK
tara:strand:+ start:565 stop:1251 length:687 start_codon:yes stop_codon:yes gene_type:complete